MGGAGAGMAVTGAPKAVFPHHIMFQPSGYSTGGGGGGAGAFPLCEHLCGARARPRVFMSIGVSGVRPCA